MNSDGILSIGSLRRKGLFLVWVGEVWNLVEMGVALWSGVDANSVALIAYALDSLIELFAGGVLIWHLSREWKGQEENEATERKAHRLIGITFFVLSAYILGQSIAALAGWLPRPEESLVGIALVIVSAIIMYVLYIKKMGIAKKIGSKALRAEAVESLVCDLQDLILLVGLGLNALLGWWWVDPLAALALIPWLLHEGKEAFSGHEHRD